MRLRRHQQQPLERQPLLRLPAAHRLHQLHKRHRQHNQHQRHNNKKRNNEFA
jgi:hypothetical protein